MTKPFIVLNQHLLGYILVVVAYVVEGQGNWTLRLDDISFIQMASLALRTSVDALNYYCSKSNVPDDWGPSKTCGRCMFPTWSRDIHDQAYKIKCQQMPILAMLKKNLKTKLCICTVSVSQINSSFNLIPSIYQIPSKSNNYILRYLAHNQENITSLVKINATKQSSSSSVCKCLRTAEVH